MGVTASAVRSTPLMIQGCRPTSVTGVAAVVGGVGLYLALDSDEPADASVGLTLGPAAASMQLRF